MPTIKQILIDRDGISPEQADELIEEARHALDKYLFNDNYSKAANICEEFFGLEPDYYEELLFGGE